MTEKYEFIDAEYAILPAEGDAPAVVQMCEWLGILKSGFYDLEELGRKARQRGGTSC